uniref:MmcB family DNA repair protein n=1 Tax=viral metagenome TaxID=1070528 RepID=A0A6M3LBZ5_9ZZZZ
MTADDIKAVLWRESELRWNTLIACEELRYPYLFGIADFIIVRRDMLTIEIEIKVNKSDLTFNETQKKKWKYNWDAAKTVGPNYFYFCIPETMYEWSIEFIKESWPFAGVLVVTDEGLLIFKRRPKRIHNTPLKSIRFIARSIYCKLRLEKMKELPNE